MTTRSFGPFRGQIVELSVVDHDDEPLPDGMAAVTVLMPVEDSRVAAQAMFLWGEFTVRVTTDLPAEPAAADIREVGGRLPPRVEKEP